MITSVCYQHTSHSYSQISLKIDVHVHSPNKSLIDFSDLSHINTIRAYLPCTVW